MFRFAELRSARLDLLYMNPEPGHQNPMDLLTDAGFVILGKICVYVIFAMFYFWGKSGLPPNGYKSFI